MCIFRKKFFFKYYKLILFFRFTSLFWEIQAVKVWPKSQKLRFFGKIHHGWSLLAPITPGRYGTGILGPVPICVKSYQNNSFNPRISGHH